MFKPHFAICICHNEQRLIVVKKGYCAEGNYEEKQRVKLQRSGDSGESKTNPGGQQKNRGFDVVSSSSSNSFSGNTSKEILGRDEEGYGGGSGTEGFIRVGATSPMVRKPIKKKPIQYRRKRTGEKEVFESIWEQATKDSQATCFVCNKNIMEPTPSNFAHILPKALNKYPLFKLNPDNIKLFCHDSYSSCHHRFDKEPRSTLKEPMWKKVFELEEQLKEEYKNLKSTL